MLIGLTGFLYWGFPNIHRVEAPKGKSPKTLATPLELGRLGALELKLELVRNQGDELTIRRLSLGIAHRIPKEPLQGIQIAPIPGYLDGVADRPLHRLGVVPKVFATWGYSTFVMALITSISFTAMMMASRRYW